MRFSVAALFERNGHCRGVRKINLYLLRFIFSY
jgi:hypothetical protein